MVAAEAGEEKLSLKPILALAGKDGVTTQTGLIVVPSQDPAQTVADKAFHSHASLVATDDRLLVCSAAGELLLVDPRADGYKLLGRLSVFSYETGLLAHPAAVGKRIYLRGNTEVVCVSLAP